MRIFKSHIGIVLVSGVSRHLHHQIKNCGILPHHDDIRYHPNCKHIR